MISSEKMVRDDKWLIDRFPNSFVCYFKCQTKFQIASPSENIILTLNVSV